MDLQVVRRSERPELWDDIRDLSDKVWPEYNRWRPRSHRGTRAGACPACCSRRWRTWHARPGLDHLIAPVRPSLKDRYPTIPIERYAHWTRPDGEPLDPWVRVHTRMGARIGPATTRALLS